MARLGTAALVALAAYLLYCASSSATLASASPTATDLAALRTTSSSCDGTLGQCTVGAVEEEEVGGEGALRRALAQRQPTNRYISYAALRADQVPCNQRGKSYYTNCASQKPANPYRRGCSAITRCQRNTN
ncbi:protein RALF-like 33 [Phragmites australis]|uniref:protein RALF-like 33 n=1 Tax=Phragmites australis TaxID=29695 RepID=UPI002D79387A|nr:protein RALF-like 33 [Phragmites australis]